MNRFSANLNRWNKQDKRGLLLFAMTLLFGLFLPALIYILTEVVAAQTDNTSRLLLLHQIQGVILDLSFSAFYAGLFFGVLTKVKFWKNALSALLSGVAVAGSVLYQNAAILLENEEINVNAAYNDARVTVELIAVFLRPLLWLGVAYVARLIEKMSAKSEKDNTCWFHLALMVLMAAFRTLPDLTNAAEKAAYYGQSVGGFIFLQVIIAAMVIAIGWFLFRAASKEMAVPAGKDWSSRSADETDKTENKA